MMENRRCFVVGPIGEVDTEIRIHSDWVFDGIVMPVFAKNFPSFKIERSDKIDKPGSIDAQIIGSLLDCDLVIADMSFLNPNVFYEIGIRHMAAKPIIHLYRTKTDIPFDVKLHRAIPFSTAKHSEVEIAKERLSAAVEAVLNPGFVVENPVTNARGVIKFKEHATPELKLLAENIAKISARLNSVERAQAANDESETVWVDDGKITYDDNAAPSILMSISIDENLSVNEIEKTKGEIMERVAENKGADLDSIEGRKGSIRFFLKASFGKEDALKLAGRIAADPRVSGVRFL